MNDAGWDWGYAAARWIGYLAAFVLIGATVTRAVIWPRARARGATLPPVRRLALLALGAGVLLLAAKAGALLGQTRSLLEPDEPVTREFLGLVLSSAWGKGWIAQTVAAAMATAVWVAAAAAPTARWATAAAAITGVGIAAAAPFTGHAVALPAAGRTGIVLDAVHFGAAGAWLGSLAVVFGTAFRRDVAGRDTSLMVQAFSPVALVAGGVAIAAGLVIGFRYVGGWEPLFSTAYGRALLLKLACLGGVAALGAWNWRLGLPHLRRTNDPDAIRGTARLELGLAALLLAVTAVLVALAAPGEA